MEMREKKQRNSFETRKTGRARKENNRAKAGTKNRTNERMRKYLRRKIQT